MAIILGANMLYINFCLKGDTYGTQRVKADKIAV